MSNYWETLRRALCDRAQALGSYIDEIHAQSNRNDDGFSRALEMCRTYTDLFTLRVAQDWETLHSNRARETALVAQLAAFLEREKLVDHWFARGTQGAVPRALKTVAREYFAAHGLLDHEPVLTMGPPDNFEAHQADLYEFLFEGLEPGNEARLNALRAGPRLSMITMPHIEGTRVLWHPITLGHEIGHVRLSTASGLTRYLELREHGIPWTEESLQESLLASLPPKPDDADDNWLADSYQNQQALLAATHAKWLDEIICDLNAVRLFGPAALSAIAEFLALEPPKPEELTSRPPSHPPLIVRLRAMFRLLDQSPTNAHPEHLRVWRDYISKPPEGAPQGTAVAGGPEPDVSPMTKYLTHLLLAPTRIDEAIDYVHTWGPAYDTSGRLSISTWIANELIDGVPAATHRVDGDATDRIHIPDVVNAAWTARSTLNGPHAASADGSLIQNDVMSPHDKRRCIDALASKAIDSIELARLWERSQPSGTDGIIATNSHTLAVAGPPISGASGGLLSRKQIAERLALTRDLEDARRRLVVTPLFSESVQDAGIDLRLGPEFIVFRHANTAAFDPLAEGDDPRSLQEHVVKAWGEQFVLHPGELVLAATLEYVVVPEDVAAQVVTRSSYGRFGLITATAVQVQPGSRTCITLELVNHGETPIALSPGVRVAQLMLSQIAEARPPHLNRYMYATGPEFSKVAADRERSTLQAIANDAQMGSGSAEVDFVYLATHPGDDYHFRQMAQSHGVTVEVAGRHWATAHAERESDTGGRPEHASPITGTARSTKLGGLIYNLSRGGRHGVEIRDEATHLVIARSNAVRAQCVLVVDAAGTHFAHCEGEGGANEVADAVARMIGQRG